MKNDNNNRAATMRHTLHRINDKNRCVRMRVRNCVCTRGRASERASGVHQRLCIGDGGCGGGGHRCCFCRSVGDGDGSGGGVVGAVDAADV
ncbi:unnamed protein product [Enterobius vermicularis]|uniref:Uncharacterized protein n=1 Tax=Enterobius vermicularis TaxID=51028 RepID=A0A0N4V9H9_ENTVE|nr:unnamed protein product [Enterobius vermicularis]